MRTTTAHAGSAVRAAGQRRRSGRVPAAGAPRAGGRAGDALRAEPRAHEPAEGASTRPDSVKKWVAFGASVRAAQYLVLGAKARALTSGRYHVSFEDIRALAHPVLRHRVLTNFRAESEGVTTDVDHRRAAAKRCRCRRSRNVEQRQEREGVSRAHNDQQPNAIPGARFVDPEGPRADREPRAAGAHRRRRLHQRPAPRAVLRRVDRLRRAPRLRAGRRHPPRRLAAVRAHRPLLRQGVRSRHEHELLGAARRLEVDGLRQPRRHQARVRAASSPRAWPTSRTASATASASSRSTTTSSTHVPPSAKHFNVVLHTLDRAKAERPGQPASSRCTKMAEHFKRRGILVADLGLLRGAGRDPRSDQAAAVPRQRPDRLPRARSGGDRASASTTRRASRISRAASRCRSCPKSLAEEYRALIRAHIEALTTQVLGAPDRLHAAQHVAAARPRAVQLSLERER